MAGVVAPLAGSLRHSDFGTVRALHVLVRPSPLPRLRGSCKRSAGRGRLEGEGGAAPRRPRGLWLAVLPCCLLFLGRPAWARARGAAGAAKKLAATGALPVKLGTAQLLLASGLVGITGSLTLWCRGLPALAEAMLWSCIRCALQLYLLGGLILNLGCC